MTVERLLSAREADVAFLDEDTISHQGCDQSVKSKISSVPVSFHLSVLERVLLHKSYMGVAIASILS